MQARKKSDAWTPARRISGPGEGPPPRTGLSGPNAEAGGDELATGDELAAAEGAEEKAPGAANEV